MPKKGEYVFLKKQKLWEKDKFTVFESISVAEDNGKQNPEQSYTNMVMAMVMVMAIN